ncbi:hypothetical protein D3C73_935230 [compost metagenome]
MNDPAVAGSVGSARSGTLLPVSALGSRLPASLCRRISHSATGPPTTPPSTRPKVAEVIARAMTSWILLKSAKRVA